ncbi:hypothetical protein ABB02_00681 [Clostridiaceae bacterium JG1575]|nr:hypothetical protein ABB02_00681 [Clostridiaceae bacterium JG1575]
MKTRLARWTISCLLFLAILTPQFVVARPAQGAPEAVRLDQKLQEELSKNKDTYDVIVYFKDGAANHSLERTLLQGGALPNREELVNQYVGDLKQSAAMAQSNALTKLASMKLAGQVQEYESAYIVNAIHVIAKKEVITQLAQDPAVASIALNERLQLIDPQEVQEVDPNDPNIPWNIKSVNSPAVWKDFKVDGTGTTIGIIDSGVEFEHPALKTKWRGYDAQTDTVVDPEKNWFEAIPSYFHQQSPIPQDTKLSHGTHVAGIILGSEESGRNQIGVAPGAKYIASRAFLEDGGSEDWILIRAGQWMLAPGGDVSARPDAVNCSWADGRLQREFYLNIIKAWRAANIVPVFAAGNARSTDKVIGPYSIENPANHKEAFAVGATDSENRLAGFSKRGPSIFDKDKEVKGIKPDVSAPGVAIRSSIFGKGYALKNGTSMAAPHVAGAVALLRQANPKLTVEEIETILKQTARPGMDREFHESPNMGFGYGIIDTYAAVSRAKNQGNAAITGRVLTQGSDGEAPRVHVTLPEGTFLRQAMPITIKALDNTGVESLKFFYTPAGTTQKQELVLKQTDGDYKEGTYEGTIPANQVKAGLMTFEWLAVDSVGNKTPGKATQEIHAAIDPAQGYNNDFENQVDGWAFKDTFERGLLNKWMLPDWSGAHSGDHIIGTDVMNFSVGKGNTDNIAMAPPIDLSNPALKNPAFGFYVVNDVQEAWKSTVEVSIDDGKNWEVLKTFREKALSWVYQQVDLTKFKGQEHVLVRFHLVTDDNTNGRGLFIDDFQVLDNPGKKPAAPTKFKVEQASRGPKLLWEDQGTSKEYAFYRSDAENGSYKKVGSRPSEKYLSPLKKEWVDSSAENTKRYYYKMTAVDYFGNESEATTPQSITNTVIPPLYFSEFETDNGALKPVSLNGKKVDWEWGNALHIPGNDTKLWGTNFEKGVTPGSEYALELPKSLTIPEKGANISFRSFSTIQWSSDETQCLGYLSAEVKPEGETNWETIIEPATIQEWGIRGTWQLMSASLEKFKGKTVQLRFHVIINGTTNTNPSFPEYGWYIDDLDVSPITETITSSGAKKTPQTQAQVMALAKEYLEKNAQGTEEPSNALPAGTLPLEKAKIQIKETGVTAHANQIGKYSLNIADQDRKYTITASKYGFHSETKTVDVVKGNALSVDFILKAKAKVKLSGTVLDAKGQPLKDAYVRVLEDGSLPILKTDEAGRYSFPEIYEGTYTLRVIASGHAVKEVAAVVKNTGENILEVKLEAVQSFMEEIKYDNGVKTDTIAFNTAGYGFAVGFTSMGEGRLKSGKLFFVDDWPDMFGTEIKIGVIVKDPKTGVVEKVADFENYIIKRGQWNTIDFAKLGVELKKGDEFYIATEQLYPGGANPALGIDSQSPYGDRSFVWNGSFVKLRDFSDTTPGSLMIRANVEYMKKEIEPPVLLGLNDENYTNKKELTLEGTTAEDGMVHLYNNDKEVHKAQTREMKFTVKAPLTEGINNLHTVLTAAGDRKSMPSKNHKMILDTKLPTLSLTKPQATTSKDRLVIQGTASDEHLDRVLINGVRAKLTSGAFEETVFLQHGANTIFVDAFDKAGNRTRQTLTVTSTNPIPALEVQDLRPDVNKTVRAGESVTISAKAKPGCKATFMVSLPNGLESAPSLELPEVRPGEYQAVWIAPKDFVADGLVVAMNFTHGQSKASAVAPGRINVINDDLVKPDVPHAVDRIHGATRHQTAVLLSQKQFVSSDAVVLVNGQAMADALVASPLAQTYKAPVLLVEKNQMPAETLKEINRLGAKNILVVGGEQVISSQLLKSLSGKSIKRFAGFDRYDTSRLVADEVVKHSGTLSAFFVGADAYADAVAAGAYVKVSDNYGISPVVLVKTGRIPKLTTVRRAFVLGGEKSISKDLEQEIYNRGYVTERLAGADRNETTLVLAKRFLDSQSNIVLANGMSLVDALVAGGYAASQKAPLLTVTKDEVPQGTLTYIKEAKVTHIDLIGGERVLSEAIRNLLLYTIK